MTTYVPVSTWTWIVVNLCFLVPLKVLKLNLVVEHKFISHRAGCQMWQKTVTRYVRAFLLPLPRARLKKAMGGSALVYALDLLVLASVQDLRLGLFGLLWDDSAPWIEHVGKKCIDVARLPQRKKITLSESKGMLIPFHQTRKLPRSIAFYNSLFNVLINTELSRLHH